MEDGSHGEQTADHPRSDAAGGETRIPRPDRAAGDAAADPEEEARIRAIRAIYEHTFQFMGLLSPEGILLETNPASLEFVGLSREDVIGRPFWETAWWQTEEDRWRLREAVERAATGEFVRYEVATTDDDGRSAVFDFSLRPVRDEEGRVVAIVPEGREITELERTREELRLSEAKLSAVVSGALDAIISIDETQRIELFNEGAERIFGYDREEVLGGPLDLLLPEEFREVHRSHVREFGESHIVARRMGERGEIVGRRRGGELFPAEASIAKVDLEGRRLYTAVLRDITQRREAERERTRLLERERRARRRAEAAERRMEFLAEAGRVMAGSLELEDTLEVVADLAVPTLGDVCLVNLLGPGGEVRTVKVARAGTEDEAGDATEAFSALRCEEAAGEAVRRGEPRLVSELPDALLEQLAPAEGVRARLRDLGPRSLMVVPLVGRESPLGALCFLTLEADSGRKLGAEDLLLAQELARRAAAAVDNARLYEEAVRATGARDDMLRVVSHDLKNPVTGILMGAKMLRLRLEPDEELEELLEGIEIAAVRQSRLIRDLRDVGSIEAGRLSVEPRPIGLPALLREAARPFESAATARGIDLRWGVEDELPPILADRDRIVQVLENLLDNALKFTPRGGSVRVGAAMEDSGTVEVWVSDTGPGIPEEERERVFERFWRGTGPDSGQAGTGLGLAIAMGIVESHGGRICAESGSGGGTTFRFSLPRAEE